MRARRKIKFEKYFQHLRIVIYPTSIKKKHVLRGTNWVTAQWWRLTAVVNLHRHLLTPWWAFLLMWKQTGQDGAVQTQPLSGLHLVAWPVFTLKLQHPQVLFLPLAGLFWRTFWLFRNELWISGDPPPNVVCVTTNTHSVQHLHQ